VARRTVKLFIVYCILLNQYSDKTAEYPFSAIFFIRIQNKLLIQLWTLKMIRQDSIKQNHNNILHSISLVNTRITSKIINVYINVKKKLK